MKNKTLILLAILLMVFLLVSRTHAQKLPNVQKTSIYAPAGVKTDGKTTEWDNKFEAQNNATNLFYTIANDATNLYLTIQARDGGSIGKMLSGGIAFTVKSNDKAVKPVVIDFLMFQSKGLTGVQKKISDPAAKLDSVLGPVNAQIANALKEIGVKGIGEITDTLISVYNEYGIKEAVQYDTNKALTAEIAIPLKYMSSLAAADAFKYNIKLKAIKFGNVSVVLNGKPVAPGSAGEARAATVFNMISISGSGGGDSFNDTDFSGVYKLAKK